MPIKMPNRERGVALLVTLLALLILSAIAATLVTMANTETTVNANYRSEETALFAARAGLYEVTDRMMQGNAASIASNIPTVVPSATNSGILYLINQTTATGTVAPWNINNKYADAELCHEDYSIAGMSSATPDIPCTTLPSGGAWYSTVNSNAPWSGTNAAMPYVWVRLNWKLNESVSYLTATTSNGVTTATPSAYAVNGTGAAATPVCWNGAAEVLLASGDTNCGQMQTGTPPTADTPVFLVTALAVTSTGGRQMLQTEVALPPPTVISTPAGFSDPDGFFATSSTCTTGSGPINLSGGITVDGYSTANGGTYATTKSKSLGSIGTNGSMVMSGGAIVGGNIHVQHTAVNGSCTGGTPSDVYTSGGATYGGLVAISPYTPPVPSIPSPGTAKVSLSGGKSQTLVPGNYDQINVSGVSSLTLTAPGTYNINCINLSGNSTLSISPATAQVVLNVTGNTSLKGTSCSGSTPVSLSGGVVTNTSGIAANLMINYAGTSTLALSGGTTTYFVVNAPNAGVSLSGGSGIYGAIIASAINDSGGVSLHFDSSLLSAPSNGTTSTSTSTSSYQSIGFRALQY